MALHFFFCSPAKRKQTNYKQLMPPTPARWRPSMAFFFCCPGNGKHILLLIRQLIGTIFSRKMASKHGFLFLQPWKWKTSIIKQLMPLTPARWRPCMAFFFCSPGNGKTSIIKQTMPTTPAYGIQNFLFLQLHQKKTTIIKQMMPPTPARWHSSVSFSASLPKENRLIINS
jgi:hypothetical protein